MQSAEGTLIVFARAPVPGEVKTRLIPLLGAQAAADLYRQLLEHAVATAYRSTFNTIELWCTPNPDHPVFEKLRKTYSVSLHPQLGTDLGVRMHTALREALSRSFFAAVIGTDSPSLTIGDVNETYRALSSGYDAVLGPAEDGGYVLIGVRQVCESLFAGIVWGGDAVARETRARLQALNWRWHELPPRWDVDLPEDVERLYRCRRGRSEVHVESVFSRTEHQQHQKQPQKTGDSKYC